MNIFRPPFAGMWAPPVDSLDADAAAYIAAVETAKGSAVTSTQRDAINAFVVGEKSASRWDSIKRLYLPIWGVAAANAICMRSLTSGTFTVSGVTHAAGYVQGNGSTGRMDLDAGASPATAGYSTSDCHMAAVIYQADSRTDSRYIGGQALGGTAFDIAFASATEVRFDPQGSNASVNPVVAFRNGIFVGASNSTSYRVLGRRGAGTAYAEATRTESANVAFSDISPSMAARYIIPSVIQGYSDARIGGFSIGNYLDPSAYSMSLKELWETCTGLTLP